MLLLPFLKDETLLTKHRHLLTTQQLNISNQILCYINLFTDFIIQCH